MNQEKLENKTKEKENDKEEILENYGLETILSYEVGFQSFLSYLETEFSTENLLFWNSIEQLKMLNSRRYSTFEQILRIFNCYIRDDAPLLINVSHNLRSKIIKDILALKTKYSYASPLPHHSRELSIGARALRRSIGRLSVILRNVPEEKKKEVKLEEKKGKDDLDKSSHSIETSFLTKGGGEEMMHIFDVAQQQIFALMNSDTFRRYLRSNFYVNLQSSGVLRSSSGDFNNIPPIELDELDNGLTYVV